MSTPGTCSYIAFCIIWAIFLSATANRPGVAIICWKILDWSFGFRESMEDKWEKKRARDTGQSLKTSQFPTLLKHKLVPRQESHNFYGSADRLNRWEKIHEQMITLWRCVYGHRTLDHRAYISLIMRVKGEREVASFRREGRHEMKMITGTHCTFVSHFTKRQDWQDDVFLRSSKKECLINCGFTW